MRDQRTRDRYDLYEAAAQSPKAQARFLRAVHPAPLPTPLTLGEDFSGTGAVSRAWLDFHPEFRAVCVDSDAEPLARLRERAAGRENRLAVRQRDVREADDPADVIATLNFSICEFHDRRDLVAYLAQVRARLERAEHAPGVFVADLYGGERAFVRGESDVELREGVRYVWEQREADPLTGRVVNAMHFHIEDGSVLRDAFVYDWRLWSAPELRDAMAEAGFARTEVYDRLADAVDESGAAHLAPVRGPDELDDDFVIYIAAYPDDRRGP